MHLIKYNSNEYDTPTCFGTGCHPLELFYSSLLVQLKDVLKEKRREKVTNGVLFLHENSPCSPGTCNPEEFGLPGLPCLHHPPYFPGLAPSDYHLFPELKKTIESSPFFSRRGGHCCRGDRVWRTNFWIFFLSGLQNLQQRAKKCIVKSMRREKLEIVSGIIM